MLGCAWYMNSGVMVIYAFLIGAFALGQPMPQMGTVNAWGLFYCGTKSFRSLQVSSIDDDKHWLTFWLIFSIVSFWLDYNERQELPNYENIKFFVIGFMGMGGGAAKVYPILEVIFLHRREVAA